MQAARSFTSALQAAMHEDLVQLLPHRKALESWLVGLAGMRKLCLLLSCQLAISHKNASNTTVSAGYLQA